MKRPTQTLIFLFDDLQAARGAIERLTAVGARLADLGVVTHDAEGRVVQDAVAGGHDEVLDPVQTRSFFERAAENGARGAVIGGLVGMLGGLAALAIPGAGPVLFLGSVAGVVAGGLLTALSTHIVDENEAVVYAEALRRGGSLVFVHDAAATHPRVGELMVEAGAVHLPSRIAAWRAAGWTGYEPPPPPPARVDAPEPPPEDTFVHEDPQGEDPWLRAHWARLEGPVAGLWPKLTAADLLAIDGHRGRLVHRVRALYGDSQELVNWRLDEMMALVLGTPAIQDSPSAHHAWTVRSMNVSGVVEE
jgi:hypothetical protein